MNDVIPASRLAPLLGEPEVRLRLMLGRVALLALAAGGIVLEHGFYPPLPLSVAWLHPVQALCLLVYGLEVWVGAWRGRLAIRDQRPDVLDALVLALGVFGVVAHGLGWLHWAWRLYELAVVVLLLMELWQVNVGISRRFYRPGLTLPLSFLTLIVVGTLLIKTPRAVPPGQAITWLEALFTMTSAVCVTGLTVRDTATTFTPFGQALIGVFIQLGGLGIIIFGSMVAMFMGTRLSLRENLTLRSMLSDQPLFRVTSLVRFFVIGTFLIEFIGAALMMPLWEGDLSFRERLGLSLFHSVSAFCNAGFALRTDSLVGFRYSALAHLVIVPLIVLGGLGFPVMSNAWQAGWWHWNRWRKGWRTAGREPLVIAQGRLSLHSKIVLTTSASLYLFGVLTIGAGQLMPYVYQALHLGIEGRREALAPLGPKTFGSVLADASFMSITARTCGFNTIPMDDIQPPGRLSLMMLMMVGGSPGSAAGGVKTTAFALLILSIVATVRQRESTEAFGRCIADALVRRAATLVAVFVAMVGLATLLLRFSEPFPFEKILFEVVSASATVGLSLGITSELTVFGKFVIIACMFLGRVGPLALLGTLMFGARPRRPYAYPAEEVVLG